MQIVADIQVLALVAVANTAPLVAKLIFGDRFSRAIDNRTVLWDGQPLFGSSKTIRGAALSIVATTALAPLVGLAAGIGLFTGISAMVGDLCSSFCKRRFGVKPSGRATGLDQIPESLLPALVCQRMLSLSTLDVLAVTAIFFVGEILLSKVLFKAHLRDRPY
jgi:CDP-2,3-bis-(O-geranylgeranyl)-sn-glycerol synthase